jgi:peptidoglycan-associated lipoprotein
MLAEGVRADQLATLSFGEEKPAAAGHGEASWSQNRRVELAY